MSIVSWSEPDHVVRQVVFLLGESTVPWREPDHVVQQCCLPCTRGHYALAFLDFARTMESFLFSDSSKRYNKHPMLNVTVKCNIEKGSVWWFEL